MIKYRPVKDRWVPSIPCVVIILLSSLTASSCGGELNRDDLIGTWIHTQSASITIEGDEQPRSVMRRDSINLNEDGTFSRNFSSRLPGEEETFSYKGRWRLSGKTLMLTYSKLDGSTGKAKGKVRTIDEYSITWGGRFFSKGGRPRTRRPGF